MDMVSLMYGPQERSWQTKANCMGVDPDLFFPERGASTREAKEVCRGCVVREDCLEYALANGEKFGIWGDCPSGNAVDSVGSGPCSAERPPAPPDPDGHAVVLGLAAVVRPAEVTVGHRSPNRNSIVRSSPMSSSAHRGGAPLAGRRRAAARPARPGPRCTLGPGNGWPQRHRSRRSALPTGRPGCN